MKAKIITAYLLSCLFVFDSYVCTANDYNIKTIDKELLQNANAVYRIKSQDFTINSDKSCTYKVKKAITILNKKAVNYGVEVIHYDKFIKVKQINAAVYDANGKRIKKIKSSEIQDRSNINDFSLYEDNRVKIVDARIPSYPFTVEFEYELEFKSTFHFPNFYPVPSYNVSLEYAEYKIKHSDPSLAPRFHTTYFDWQKDQYIEDKYDVQKWTINSFHALEKESYSPSIYNLIPVVNVSPSKFYYDGYSGNMSSWESIGEWINQLNKDRNVISEKTIAEIKAIKETANSDRELVNLLYKYMQNRTRYVSIQLGIGGYQPFEAMMVDKLGYGDCKALSNYMKSILEIAGIPSYYTLILAGKYEQPLIADFPSLQFNHAILAVPLNNDTLWLECTSQTNPFNYSGTFTGNREALLINESGGHVVKTNYYGKNENTQISNIDLKINKDGEAEVSLKTVYSGIQAENNNIYRIVNKGEKDKKEWLLKNLPISNFSIRSFNFHNNEEDILTTHLSAELALKNAASVSGKRMFISPNLFNKHDYVPSKLADRKFDLYYPISYNDVDSVRISLPESYYFEFPPENISINSNFGNYELEWVIDQAGEIMMIRKMSMYEGNYDSTEYAKFVDFFGQIKKADQTQLVFLKST